MRLQNMLAQSCGKKGGPAADESGVRAATARARLSRPEEIAAVATFLLSDEASCATGVIAMPMHRGPDSF